MQAYVHITDSTVQLVCQIVTMARSLNTAIQVLKDNGFMPYQLLSSLLTSQSSDNHESTQELLTHSPDPASCEGLGGAVNLTCLDGGGGAGFPWALRLRVDSHFCFLVAFAIRSLSKRSFSAKRMAVLVSPLLCAARSKRCHNVASLQVARHWRTS